MTSFPSLKEPLTLEQLKTFRENFEITFAEELNGPDWHGYYTTYSIPDFSLSWTNETEHNFVKKEFVNYSYFLTGEQDSKKIDQKLLEIEQDLSKNPGQVYRVTPTEEATERGERLAEEQKIQAAESKASAEAKTQEFIELQKRLAEEIATQAGVDKATAEQISANYARELLITKAQEKLYFNLPKKANIPELSSDEETKIKELIEEKVKPNPTYYADSLAKEIVKQNKTPQMSRGEATILETNAKLVAIGYTNNLLALESKEKTVGDVVKLVWAKNPIHIAASLANPENPFVGKETAKSAQITALTIEHDNLLARNLLSKVVDSKTLSLFYPGANELIIYEVSDKENKETFISVDRKAFTDQGIKLGESNNQVFSFVKENLWGEIKDRSWGFLDKTLENTSWYSKVKSLLPDFLKPNIPVVAAGETAQPGLSLLWSKQGIQLLSSDMPALLASSFEKSIFLTPSFGLQFGEFVTTEGVTGQFFGINFGDFGIKIVHFGEEAALDIFKQLRIVEGVPRVAITGGVVPVVGEAVTGGIGTAVGETGVAVGEAAAGKTVTGAAAIAAKKTAGGVAGGLLGKVAAKLGLTPAITAITQVLGSFAPIVGNILAFIATWLAQKLIEPILLWIKKHQEDLKILGLIMLGGAFLLNPIPAIIVGTIGGLILVSTTLKTGLSVAGIAARTAFFFGRIGKSMVITIGTPIIVAIVVFPILVAIILFIINSGAYIVPPGSWGPPGGGGGGTAAPCPDGGIEITADLAGKITGGVVQLLPDSNGARASHFCITPTMIILHSSGGYDNPTGADMTFGTLVEQNLACQLATDTVKTLLMQPFYETQVEMAWCANSWDSYGVSIEISGECLEPEPACNSANSSCGPYDNPVFNNPPPHPCDPETDNAVSAVCAVMNQYKIPWCQVYTHDDVPNAIHEDPTGKDWVYNYFIPKVKNICPNDQGGLCN